jgi:hypothetical protein
MQWILLVVSLFVTHLNANMAREGFERFFNYYFVETGTYSGDGINFALRAGFPEIFSVEIAENFHADATTKFANYKNVHLILGDSGLILFNVIKDLNRPITFWLDGHMGDVVPGCTRHTPLLEELDEIKKHPIKHHTIIIDDMHCCNGILFDFLTREDIIAKIKEINPNYEIVYIDGGNDPEIVDNIMVAYVPFAKWNKN